MRADEKPEGLGREFRALSKSIAKLQSRIGQVNETSHAYARALQLLEEKYDRQSCIVEQLISSSSKQASPLCKLLVLAELVEPKHGDFVHRLAHSICKDFVTVDEIN